MYFGICFVYGNFFLILQLKNSNNFCKYYDLVFLTECTYVLLTNEQTFTITEKQGKGLRPKGQGGQYNYQVYTFTLYYYLTKLIPSLYASTADKILNFLKEKRRINTSNIHSTF